MGNTPPWLQNSGGANPRQQQQPQVDYNTATSHYDNSSSGEDSFTPQMPGQNEGLQAETIPASPGQRLSGGLRAMQNPGMPMGYGGPAPRQQQPPMVNYNQTSGTNGPAMSGVGSDPGTQMSQQTPYEGSPAVTETRASTAGLPDVASGLNTSNLPALQTGLDTSNFAGLNLDFAGADRAGADAAYGAASQYFDQDFGRDRDALQNQLVNQGLTPGSQAYNDQMSLMERGQNQARTGAALQAQGIGHAQSGDMLMRALQTRQQQAAEAGQGANTALAARGALTGEQGQSAGIGLAARGLLGTERQQDADRLYNQSMGVAGLGLQARGQSMGRDTALQSNATQAAAAANAANNQRYGIDTSAQLGLRGLGLQQDNMDFNQLMQLINSSRGGVNMPNFGGVQPLDVTGANQIASSNNNADQNRQAQDRGNLANLGGAAINGLLRYNGY
jgi:hypothetical protein